MTDIQLLTSMKSRASQRLGNFIFISMLDELINQSRQTTLERDVVEHLAHIARLYISIDEQDLSCLNDLKIERQPRLCDQERVKRLHAVGFMIGRDIVRDQQRLRGQQ